MHINKKFPDFSKHLYTISKLIDTPQKIAILMHKNPDADALGSSLAFAKFLRKKKHQVEVISPNISPTYLSWMLESETVTIFEKNNKACEQILQKAHTIFCLDFSSLSRIFEMALLVKKSPATKIIIDHHLHPENFADICISQPKASATSLIIYKILTALNYDVFIDLSIATYLYTGIVTDTGYFQNPNTNIETHQVVAEILKKGVDVSLVNQKLYGNSSLNKLKFTAHAITHRLTVLPLVKTAYFTIPQKDFKKFKLEEGDTDGLVNYALRLKDITCAVLLTQHVNNTRLSFRSVGNFAVNDLAKKYFNGGGHKNAAGGVSSLSLSQTTCKLVDILTKINTQPQSLQADITL